MAALPAASSRSQPALTSRYGAVASGGVFLAASYLGYPSLALPAAALLLLAALCWLSAFLSTWQLHYRRRLSASRGFPGDEIVVRSTLYNAKPLPAPWLEVSELLPAGLVPTAEESSIGGHRRLLHLRWHSGAVWSHRLCCRRRGVYQLAAVELRGGDPYGLASRCLAGDEAHELLVYPALLPPQQWPLPARQQFGPQRPPSALHEDPARLAGLRAYQAGDALNRIAWKASARQRQLQVRVFEPSASPKLLLLLAGEHYAHPSRAETGEYALSLLASLARENLEQGVAVGALVSGGRPVALPPASGREQLTRLLEGLARLDLWGGETSLPELLVAQRPLLAAANTVAVIGEGLDEAGRALLQPLTRQWALVELPLGSAEPAREGVAV